jgi:hypothetical protein
MRRRKIFFTVIIGTIALFLSIPLVSAQADFKDNYYDYQEMVMLLTDLQTQAAAKTPNVYSLQIIGYSYQNNPIYAVKFSDNPGIEQEDKPVVVIDSGIHANEWLPVESNLYFIQYLFNAYYTSGHPDHTEIVDLVNNFEIWIIPMINADGRIRDDLNQGDPDSFWTATTYHPDDTVGWRMNVQELPCAAKIGGTNQGIDLNRNFSYKFWELSNCTRSSYSGNYPFAAPETRALKQFINNHMVSLVLHQHSNAQIIYSASAIPGLGAYLSEEAVTIFNQVLPNPLMELINQDLSGVSSSMTSEKADDSIGILASGACNGSGFTGQYYMWLWTEIDCILAPDNHSKRAIQNVFYEYDYEDYTPVYGYINDGKVGQYAPGDGSNGFHPSSGEMNHWIIDRNVEINKYLIRQSRYPFSPRYNTDMSRRPEAPVTDLAIVGAKITKVGTGLPGCLITDSTGRDLIEPGMKRISWNVQNDGTSSRTINSDITICNLTDDPSCLSPYTAILSRDNVLPDAIETFTYDYAFASSKDYSLTLTTGENNSYNNDLKRFIFTTMENTLINLALFQAASYNRKIVLEWVTESEIDNEGFNLYRSESENGTYIKINDSLILSEGSATQGAFYEFIDKNVKNRKTYYYRLEDIDFNGKGTMHGPVSATPRLIFGRMRK